MVAEIGSCGTWDLQKRNGVRSEIQFLYSFMKQDYEKLIPLSFREFYKLSIVYRFAGIRRVLTELEADN